MSSDGSPRKFPLQFFILVFALSIPFWLLGAFFNDYWRRIIPINLPISALMIFCPLAAAAICIYREKGFAGVKELLKRTFDHQKTTNKLWYIPIVLLSPLIMVLSYFVMRLLGRELPAPEIPWLTIPVFFILFFAGSIGEELGWQGYAFDRIENRRGAFRAAVFLGSLWGLWHTVPYF